MSDAALATPALLFAHLDGQLAGLSRSRRLLDAGFGEQGLRVNFHGFPDGTDYGRALRPHSPGMAPSFSIDVIDGAGCGIGRPRLAWARADFGPKRVVPGWSDRDWTTYLLRGEQGLAIADWRTGRAIVWLPSHAAVPWYERAAPFRWLFDGLAARMHLSTLHAAVVGLDGQGLLLAGPGGAGKSTLALAAMGEGFDYVGDDYCLLSRRSSEAFALYSSAKWKRDADVVPPWLTKVAPDAIDETELKNVIFLEAARPECLVDRLAIGAIVVPARGADQTLVEPLAPQAALRALAASTLAQSEASGEDLVSALAALVRAVPAFRLAMTRSLNDAVAALRGVLAHGH